MKKPIFIGVSVLVIGGAIWFFFLRTKTTQDQYQFVTVERGDVEQVVSSTGTLNPVTTVQVGTQVSGRIAKLYADFNQRVRKGQLLAELDTSSLLMAVMDAEAAIERARSQLKQAESDFSRTEYLFKEELKAKADYETAQNNLESAKANHKSAQSNLERARINLSYASIYAPVDGIVVARNVDIGQTVAASLQAPTLFLIANDLTKMQILANVDESDIGEIREGQKVRFTVQAYSNRNFEGIVDQIRLQPTTISNVVNYTVVANVANDQQLLLPGMTATIDFLIGQAKNVLKVPNAALRIKPNAEMQQELMREFEERAKSNPQLAERLKQFRQRANGNGAAGSTPFVFGGNSGGASAGNGSQRPRDRGIIWYLDADGRPKAIRVRTGISDGQSTEIKSDEIKEGMTIIRSVAVETNTTASGPAGGPRMRMF